MDELTAGRFEVDGIRVRRVIVRDLVVQADIGVFPEERGRLQDVRISVAADVADTPKAIQSGHLTDVVSYADVVDGIRRLVAAGRINLVETMADRIAGLCLADPRVLRVRVTVEKPHAIANAAGVGVVIERHRTDGP